MTEDLPGSERLFYRPLHISDLPAIESILGDQETMALSLLAPLSALQILHRLQQIIQDCQFPVLGKLAVIEQDTGCLVGYCGIERSVLEGHSIYEFGVMLRKCYWGMGYGSEAAERVLNFQYSHSALEKVFAIVDSRHFSSIRVLQKAGMKAVRNSSYGDRTVQIFML
ncbi:MAG: GNAT family N-acetyltransferase [Motiliproteus sp.]